MSTTVQHYNLTPGNESTYIITGDIEAMWLRDSTNQFIPYIRMPYNCTHMPAFTKGLLNTQAQFIMVDGYTNAFKRFEVSKILRPSYLNDVSQTLIMGIPVDLCRKREFATEQIWQRKWEVDSPAAFLRLSHQYYSRFRKLDIFNMNFFKALARVISVLDEQTNDSMFEQKMGKNFYTFKRNSDQLPGGTIKRAVYTGMIKTGFRPSDSPNELPYNIPCNAMISKYLELVAVDVLSQVPKNSVFRSLSQKLSQRMLDHSQRIKEGIYKFGLVQDTGVQIFAYQVDGTGSYRIYDDSNLPCLLSLAYLKFVGDDDQTFQNTKRFVLSERNKYFYARGAINGVGSSHTDPRYIWPLALTIQILSSKSNNQIRNCLDSLMKGAKDNLLHESFSVDDPSKITREWFAWANSFFGEMIMYLAQTNPSVLK